MGCFEQFVRLVLGVEGNWALAQQLRLNLLAEDEVVDCLAVVEDEVADCLVEMVAKAI